MAKGVWLSIDIPFDYPDKWKHIIGAFILAILFYAAFPRISVWKSLLAWIVVTSIFEALQPLITNGQREFEWLDIVMNVTGFSIVAVFYFIKLNWCKNRFSN